VSIAPLQSGVRAVFSALGAAATYTGADGTVPVQVVLRQAWDAELQGFDSRMGEGALAADLLTTDVPAPRRGDQLLVGGKHYRIDSILTKDQYVTRVSVVEAGG
jgi:hypothetical protein